MKLKKFQSIIDNTPENVKAHVKLSMDILDRINELLVQKFDGKQKLLADKMGKSEAEVSKWLNGVQNFTTKTLVKLQIAFGEPIIAVCTHPNDQNSEITTVKTLYTSSPLRLVINNVGELDQRPFKFKSISSSNNQISSKPTLPA